MQNSRSEASTMMCTHAEHQILIILLLNFVQVLNDPLKRLDKPLFSLEDIKSIFWVRP